MYLFENCIFLKPFKKNTNTFQRAEVLPKLIDKAESAKTRAETLKETPKVRRISLSQPRIWTILKSNGETNQSVIIFIKYFEAKLKLVYFSRVFAAKNVVRTVLPEDPLQLRPVEKVFQINLSTINIAFSTGKIKLS